MSVFFSSLRGLGFVLSCATSIVFFLAVFIFGPLQIAEDQSRYRLSKYLGTSVEVVESLRPVKSELYQWPDLKVSNAVPLTPRRYQGVLSDPAFIELTADSVGGAPGRIVTKLMIDAPADDLMLDSRIVHWVTTADEDFSDDRYYKYPVTSARAREVIYIDGDVAKVRIMPTVRRGRKFSAISVSVQKYRVP